MKIYSCPDGLSGDVKKAGIFSMSVRASYVRNIMW